MDLRAQRLNRVVEIIAKIIEVFMWVGAGLMAVGLIIYFLDESFLKYVMDIGEGEFAVLGYTVFVIIDGQISPPPFITAMILGVIVCGLTAMVFRNIHLIFKTTEGKTKFSQGATPFQPANVRMIREIGIFSIAITVTEFISDMILRIIAGNDVIESSVSTSGIVFGIVLLCLSQFFAYGVQLQQDSDGLV